MEKLIITLAAALLATFSLSAQNITVPEGFELVDSVVYRQKAAMDSTLEAKTIFSVLPAKGESSAGVAVHQSQNIVNGMNKHIANNASKTLSGYRVRIFFDNKQNSRGASEAAMARFMAAHPGIPAYRSFVSPFFKVTVGDFRTNSEAMHLLESIKGEFPSAFVVKEHIQYPAVDKYSSYIVDTVKVLRPKDQ